MLIIFSIQVYNYIRMLVLTKIVYKYCRWDDQETLFDFNPAHMYIYVEFGLVEQFNSEQHVNIGLFTMHEQWALDREYWRGCREISPPPSTLKEEKSEG